MTEIIDLSGNSRPNAPVRLDYELMLDSKEANMSLIVKINEACDKERRLRVLLNHTCEQNWLGKLFFSVSAYAIFLMQFLS